MLTIQIHDERLAGDHEHNTAGNGRETLVEPALGVAENAAECVVRHDP